MKHSREGGGGASRVFLFSISLQNDQIHHAAIYTALFRLVTGSIRVQN